MTATFNPASTTGNTTVLTLCAANTTPLGTFSITVTATGGGLTRSFPITIVVNPAQPPDFSLAANPASVTVVQGATATSAINITRLNGFTSAVAFSASGLPGGVTAAFNPQSATGNTSTLTFTAASNATTGPATVTVTGTGGGLTHATTISLMVSGTGGGGGVTITPVINASGPWFNEEALRLDNTGTITSLSITITIQRTTGVSFNGQYNTVGSQIVQTNSSTATAVTYQFSLAAGQTLGVGSNRLFAAQTSGTGTVHPTAGDLWTVTFTSGGTTVTQSGHF
ncbi:MAG TPA: hypothetical protein VFV34_03855 [Blastocatellia bacterium]|nr:hypothetical protein [Blastocatellia bacterium]